MKILIEMLAEHYDLFVAECDIIKNALVLRDENSRENRVIDILCDKEELEILLEAANRLYPKAVAAIEAGMTLAHEV